VPSATRNPYNFWKQSKSPGARRTEELRQLASEGIPVTFESRSLCLSTHSFSSTATALSISSFTRR
jgi:hypothetical protein